MRSQQENKMILKIIHNSLTHMLKYLQRDQHYMRNYSCTNIFKMVFLLSIIGLIIISPITYASVSDNVKFSKITDVSAEDAYDILVDEGDDVCYVSFGVSGVKSYNINSYQSPKVISWVPEENNGYAHQIYKLGPNIYVGDGRAGITVIDWSIQNSPQVVNRTLGYYGWAVTSDEAGNTLFLASGGNIFGYDPELVVFNVSQLGQFELITTVPLPGDCVDVEVENNILYITANRIPLITFDVSNVSEPIELDRTGENIEGSFATDIEIIGDYAYVANWQGPFQIFDIQDPSNLTLAYESPVNQVSSCVESSGDILYFTNATEGLVLYNVSTPDIPTIIGIYDDNRYQYRVDIVGDYIFMTQQSYGFVILKIAQKQIPGYSLGFTIYAAVFTIGIITFLLRRRVLK